MLPGPSNCTPNGVFPQEVWWSECWGEGGWGVWWTVEKAHHKAALVSPIPAPWLSQDDPLSTLKPPRNISLIAFNHWILAPRRFQFIKGTQIFRPAAFWRLAKDKVGTDRQSVCVWASVCLRLRVCPVCFSVWKQGNPISSHAAAALAQITN